MSSDLDDPTGVNHYVAPAPTTTLVVDAVRVDDHRQRQAAQQVDHPAVGRRIGAQAGTDRHRVAPREQPRGS